MTVPVTQRIKRPGKERRERTRWGEQKGKKKAENQDTREGKRNPIYQCEHTVGAKLRGLTGKREGETGHKKIGRWAKRPEGER